MNNDKYKQYRMNAPQEHHVLVAHPDPLVTLRLVKRVKGIPGLQIEVTHGIDEMVQAIMNLQASGTLDWLAAPGSWLYDDREFPVFEVNRHLNKRHGVFVILRTWDDDSALGIPKLYSSLYVAGCWTIDGTAEKAEEVFAEACLRRSRGQAFYIPIGGDKGLPQEVLAHLEAYPSANAEADRIEQRMVAWLDAQVAKKIPDARWVLKGEGLLVDLYEGVYHALTLVAPGKHHPADDTKEAWYLLIREPANDGLFSIFRDQFQEDKIYQAETMNGWMHTRLPASALLEDSELAQHIGGNEGA